MTNRTCNNFFTKKRTIKLLSNRYKKSWKNTSFFEIFQKVIENFSELKKKFFRESCENKLHSPERVFWPRVCSRTTILSVRFGTMCKNQKNQQMQATLHFFGKEKMKISNMWSDLKKGRRAIVLFGMQASLTTSPRH